MAIGELVQNQKERKMRESRNKMQPEISLGTPEEVGLV